MVGPLLRILPRTIDLAQGAPQRIDFVFVGVFLAFRQFQRLQNFFHVIKRLAKFLDDVVDLINGAANIGGRGGLSWRFCALGHRRYRTSEGGGFPLRRVLFVCLDGKRHFGFRGGGLRPEFHLSG